MQLIKTNKIKTLLALMVEKVHKFTSLTLITQVFVLELEKKKN
jgi:hypothetical protein